MMKLYRWLTIIASPIIDLYFMHRKLKGKEHAARFPERLGKTSKPRPEGRLVWFHASSVGEVMSVLPLMKLILEEYPSLHILLTTGTVTSSNLIEGKLPKGAIHQFAPIDKISNVRRFIRYWKPDLALWVESEFWPNLLTETHYTGCPIVLINGRVSRESVDRWQRTKSLAKQVMGSFTAALAQSEEDKNRLTKIGIPQVEFVGNLKYDAPALPADPKETGELISQIGERPIWLAASTHEGEEHIVAEVHKELEEKYENLLTIIIPRHPERGNTISSKLSEMKLSVALRSKKQLISDDIDVYIANTIGELGIFYRLSGIVFMGGSLIEHGGQNPLEAARLECAILTGPYTQNFNRIYDDLVQTGGSIRVRSKDELKQEVDQLLSDVAKMEEVSELAMNLVNSKSGALNSYMEKLQPFLSILEGKTPDA